MSSVHLLIKGKVQGVFYRVSAKETADKLGVGGWVKNTREGHVEAMVSGDEMAVKEFTAWCKKGPANARVIEVTVTPVSELLFEVFEIKRG